MSLRRTVLAAATLALSGGMAAAQTATPDLAGVASFEEAVARVATARGQAELPAESRGLVCAALIVRGLCAPDTALELLADAASPTGLYIRSALLARSDPALARDVLEQAAAAGHPNAQADLGAILLQAGAAAEAEDWLTQSAAQENPAGMHILGMAYMKGDVLDENHYEGSFLIEQAAEAGHPQAIYELGLLHLNGIGVGRDMEKAAALLRQAGDLGMPDGYYLAAAAHLDGPDVYRDYRSGLAMAEAAAEAGQVYAMILMGDLLSMRGRPFANATRAKAYYRQAASAGVPEATKIAERRLATADAPSLADTIRGGGGGFTLDSTQKGLLMAGGALVLFGLLSDGGGPGGAAPHTSYNDSPGMQRMNFWATEGMMAGP